VQETSSRTGTRQAGSHTRLQRDLQRRTTTAYATLRQLPDRAAYRKLRPRQGVAAGPRAGAAAPTAVVETHDARAPRARRQREEDARRAADLADEPQDAPRWRSASGGERASAELRPAIGRDPSGAAGSEPEWCIMVSAGTDGGWCGGTKADGGWAGAPALQDRQAPRAAHAKARIGTGAARRLCAAAADSGRRRCDPEASPRAGPQRTPDGGGGAV